MRSQSQALFLDSQLVFEGGEKTAGMLTRLSDNTDNWPQEIVQEAYKRLPFLSDYEAYVILDKINEERGYAFGSVELRPKTDMTASESMETGLPKAHIPVIVKEQMLSPLDVFLKGKKYCYLTEGRLREALFRPSTFDVFRRRPPEAALVNDLQPPMHDLAGGGVKIGSIADLPILPLLHGTVSSTSVSRVKKAAAEPSVYTQIMNGDPGVRSAFTSAMGLQESMPFTKEARVTIKPSVVQLKKLGAGRAMVKWANMDAYDPQEDDDVPMSVAQDLLGDEDLVAELENDGTVTMSPDAAVKQTMEAEEVKAADSFGLWKVQDLTGNSMIGWVFPKLLTLDMEVMPLCLFNNGSQHALQEVVAGEPAGKSLDLPKGVPQGYGTLYYMDHGTAKAFVPMTVKTTARMPEGLKYVAETDLGEPVTFSYSDGLKKPVKIGETEWILPSAINWMPLRGKTELVSEPALFSKIASIKKTGAMGTVVITGDRTGVYSFDGPAVAKLASRHTQFIPRNEAMFLGVGLGMDRGFCKEALDRAQSRSVSVAGLNVATSYQEKVARAKLALKKEMSELNPPIRNYFLAKEASILDDALTADKVLGLGFINPENISTFVDLIPALDAASGKLAELLILVRLGLKEIPEVAVERMLFAMEDVLRGLKSLRQKELTYSK